MSLLDLPIPPRPDHFGPDGAPPGVELRLDVFGVWAQWRNQIDPRVCIVHTNAASVEAPVQSSINYGNAATNNTKPHYLVGDKPAKVLRTDKRAIANSTEDWFEQQMGEIDCSFWTIAIETADLGSKAALAQGYNWPTDCGPFLTSHAVPDAEIVARIYAYESIVHDFPLDVVSPWNGSGCATHTAPFPHPHYTIQEGKTCPGATKKTQFETDVLPRARQIRDAWLGTPQGDPIPVYSYFNLKAAPSTLWQVVAPGVALRIEGETLDARGGLPGPVPILSAAEASRFVFLNGLTAASVR